MGSQSPQSLKEKMVYYSTETHPIEGQVDVFQIYGESMFLITNSTSSKKTVELAELIQSEKSMFLINYFGNSTQNENLNININCKMMLQEEYAMYWGYYNYDLAAETLKNIHQKTMVQQKSILRVAQSCILGASTLRKYNLFMEFSLSNVQIAPDRTIKLYWGNLQSNNSHRSYFKGYPFGDFKKNVFYAPEELVSINSMKLHSKIDLEKASIFSLGIVFLCFAMGVVDAGELYQYEGSWKIKEIALKSLLDKLKIRYSTKVFTLISSMLQLDPHVRGSFSVLKTIILTKEEQKTDLSHVINIKERKNLNWMKKASNLPYDQININTKNLRS